MTAQEHNKVIGILFSVLGGVGVFSLLLTAVQFAIGNGFKDLAELNAAIHRTNPDFPDILYWFTVILLFSSILGLLTSLLELAAAFGMLKRTSWARVVAITAAVLALLGIPLGTAFGIYALWFLFSEKGKQFYRGIAE